MRIERFIDPLKLNRPREDDECPYTSEVVSYGESVALHQNFALDHLSKTVRVGLDLLVVHEFYRTVQDERPE